MANLTQVLYGNRLYGAVTYEENYDPQTLTASLGDTQASSEADIFHTAKPLSDTQASADAIAKLIEKLLADTQGSSESRIASLLKALSESQGSTDAVVLAGAKALSELITLSEAWTTVGTKVFADSSSMAEGFLKAIFRAFNFSELVSGADATVTIQATKVLLESLSVSAAVVKTVEKVFSEITTSSPVLFGAKLFGAHTYSSDMIDPAIYMREKIVHTIGKVVAEAITVSDRNIAIHQTKGLLDSLVVQEWVEIQLHRVNIWASTPANEVISNILTVFGKSLYAEELYAATPTVSWDHQGSDKATWGVPVEVGSSPALYGRKLFGQALFSDTPTVLWAKTSSRQEEWANQDHPLN